MPTVFTSIVSSCECSEPLCRGVKTAHEYDSVHGHSPSSTFSRTLFAVHGRTLLAVHQRYIWKQIYISEFTAPPAGATKGTCSTTLHTKFAKNASDPYCKNVTSSFHETIPLAPTNTPKQQPTTNSPNLNPNKSSRYESGYSFCPSVTFFIAPRHYINYQERKGSVLALCFRL